MTVIHKKILYFFSPNALAIKAPPIGERMTGVRNETPIIPYLLHILTFLLFATVNNLRFLPKREKTLDWFIEKEKYGLLPKPDNTQ